ncbi:MAG: hypothetical protein JOZ18_13150, partial [Chloroflexi bacterium]|nr:hypothetical protein [Chloroflexota bacterium]
QLAQRPDPRRTRQLLRQNILASKGRTVDEQESQTEQQEPEQYGRHTPLYEEQEGEPPYSRRNPTRSGYITSPRVPSTSELMEEEEEWSDFEDVDPDIGYEDQLDMPPTYSERRPGKALVPPRARQVIPERSRRQDEMAEYEDEDDEYYEDDEDDAPPVRRRKRKGKVSRRGMLVGLGVGVAAVAGTGVAAYELGPKLPQALSTAGSNIEHQLQDAFNKGVEQGAENVRREFVTALENLEGFTLDGAVSAAKLTRVAYDVFVSPVIKFGATITGDFLGGMLRAFKTARGWLAGAYQDNSTLIAIQKVLETWVAQVSIMPKQLDAITDTDLDGAQAYLRALQRKIEDEKAKLNNANATPTPTAQPTPRLTQKTQ